jgi:rhodanese-related sulfurtransferase
VNSLPLDAISTRIKELPKTTAEKPLIIHCAGGYRSMVFASIIKANGHHHIMDVIGGFNAIKEMKGVPVSVYDCPSGSGGNNDISV